MIARIDTPNGRLWICGDSTGVNALRWNPIERTGHTGEMDWIVSALDGRI